MNCKFLIVSLLTLPFTVMGQVTLKNTEDFTVGTVLKFQECDTSGVQPGFTGPKQTWDFSSVKASSNTVTETMVAPETTPNGKQYPKANIVEKYSDGRYVYTDKESILSTLVGYVGNGMVIEYAKPMVFAKRPVSFGGTNSFPYTDKFTSNGMGFHGTGTVILAADGYGTLITPDKKKYSNALRIKITQKQRDTLIQKKSVSNMMVTTYVWFDEKHKSALFKISITSSPAYNNKSVEYLLNEEDK